MKPSVEMSVKASRMFVRPFGASYQIGATNPISHTQAGEERMKIKWTDWAGAVPVPEEEREEWAQEALANVQGSDGPKDFLNMSSGDTLVVAMRFGSRVEVYDCIIRRQGRPL